MEKSPRFGESFNPDQTNRLDPFRKDLPEYVNLGRAARERLAASIEDEGWPEQPSQIENLGDFFNQAKDVVSQRWLNYAQNLFQEKCGEWLKIIPETEENEEIIRLLSDPAELESALRRQQFDTLESLRGIAPEAWRSLVMLSSERQLASVVLLRHWEKDLPAADLEKMGITREELDLFIDLAGILGKYIDHAYVKQIELADAPGGSTKTKLTGKTGAGYLYDPYRSPETDEIDVKPYVEVFGFEWPRLVRRFEALAESIEKQVAAQQLPESYAGLPQYLRRMSAVYGSNNLTPKKLNDEWEALSAACRELALGGCPVMLVPQACEIVAGDASKVDVELRLGFRTKEDEAKEKIFEPIRQAAMEINQANRPALKRDPKVPPLILNHQPFAFGPNLYMFTPAESTEETILTHTNALEAMATAEEMPAVGKILGFTPDAKRYGEAALLEAGLHENSHRVLSDEDEAVKKRIGRGNDANVLEELKAETIAAKLLIAAQKKGELAADWEQQFLAKLGTIANYFGSAADEGTLGERYHYVGIAMAAKLLASGAVRENGDRYEVVSAERGFAALAELGDEVMQYYTNPAGKPADVKNYIKKLKALTKDPSIVKLSNILKS